MSKRGSRRIIAIVAVLTFGVACILRGAEGPQASSSGVKTTAAQGPAAGADKNGKVVHPLSADIEEARARLISMEKDIQDYSCTMVKRERVDGKLSDFETMFLKVRHKPFSVYIYFMSPPEIKGQQVVYIEGRNGGNLIAQPVGLAGKFGPYSLPITGILAMQGQRYSITEIGFLNLTRRLIEVGSIDDNESDTLVKHIDNVKLSGGSGEPRICRLTEVVHPVKRDDLRYYMARIYIDKERNIPLRFESYAWPATPGGAPELLEEYTYLDVKLNNGFTDADFEIRK